MFNLLETASDDQTAIGACLLMAAIDTAYRQHHRLRAETHLGTIGLIETEGTRDRAIVRIQSGDAMATQQRRALVLIGLKQYFDHASRELT